MSNVNIPRWVPVLLLSSLVMACEQQLVDHGGIEIPDTIAPDTAVVEEPRPYLILLSLDGFRPDYLSSYSTVHLGLAIQRGTVAESPIPVFPTHTFPNHYTQATGLYPERHGIVANNFWDPARQRQFRLGDPSAVGDGSWYRGEPIWVTAERQGVRAASFYWVGSEAEIGGIRPSIWKPYDGSVPNTARVDSVLSWLELPDEQRPRLITLYMSSVDGAGHVAGPHTARVEDAVLNVDRALGRLMDGIAALPLADSVYLVITSDHGMARYEAHQYELLSDHIDTHISRVRVATSGPFASLHVQSGPSAEEIRDRLNAGLRHGRAYLRQETPERLRYREDPRIGDVVVIMDEPYHIRRSAGLTSGGGNHGWDPANESMRGILMMVGPSIPSRQRIAPVEMVDLYPFFTEILRLDFDHDIDGRPGALRELLDGVQNACDAC